jgi:hypothetical protein
VAEKLGYALVYEVGQDGRLARNQDHIKAKELLGAVQIPIENAAGQGRNPTSLLLTLS